MKRKRKEKITGVYDSGNDRKTGLSVTVGIVILFFLTLSSCSRLKQGEIAKIEYQELGCFGTSKKILTFFKTGEAYYARLSEGQRTKVLPIGKTVLLNLNMVIGSVRSLRKSGGCTSSIQYTVYTPSEIIYREDEGCQQTCIESLFSLFKEPIDVSYIQ